MLQKLRIAYGKRILVKAISRVKKTSVLPISAVRKCVIILDEDTINSSMVHNIEQILEEANPAMNIHFVSYSKKPNEKTTLPIEKLMVLYRNDLNWYYRPKQLSFGVCDLIIDLTEKPILPLQFLSVFSNAQLKVGSQKEWKQAYLTLMIQTKETEGIDFTTEQLMKYINMINNGKNAA